MYDVSRFDEITKQSGEPISRRKALKAFLAGGAMGAVALLQAPYAQAALPGRCRKVKAICRQDYECCDFYCNPASGRCECPPGSNFCRRTKRCVRCFGGGTFDPDTCTCTCPPGTVQCDPFHCCEDRPESTADCCPGGYCNYCYDYYGQYYCYC